jgi:hypothetical protein
VGAGADPHGARNGTEAIMRVVAILVTGLALAAQARADEKPAAQSDVNRGVDANTPKAPDHHGKVERHWDPDHVEARERSTARNDAARTTRSRKTVRPETTEEHRKVEKRADGSTRSEVEKTRSYDDGSGETKDHEKTVVDSKVNDNGGRTITREVDREHDAPGAKNQKTHVKEKIEKDANGNVIKRERSE